MKIVLILVVWYLYSVQIIDSKKYSIIFDDELLPYTIEKGVPSFLEYFSIEHLVFELIDDDKVEIGGYGECIKSMDPKLPVQFAIRTQYLDQSSWREAPTQLLLLNFCPEAVNPSRLWYNISKLWTNCPIQKGDKWFVERQIINAHIDMPPSFSMGKWRAHILFTQGLLGSVTKFGAMLNVELIAV